MLLLALLVAQCGEVPQRPAIAALVLEARGASFLEAGQFEAAEQCLQRAATLDSEAVQVQRSLALLKSKLGRWEEARRHAVRAQVLGDPDPALDAFLALLAARLGDRRVAREEASRAQTWQGDLLAAWMGDPGGAQRVFERAREPGPRGAWSALVLAGAKGEAGDRVAAERLLDWAESRAEAAEVAPLVAGARQLRTLLEDRRAWLVFAAVRTGLDHTRNPTFLAGTGDPRAQALRATVRAQGAVSATLGATALRASFRFDQHGFLSQRQRLEPPDMSAMVLEAQLARPLADDPAALNLGLVVRFTDVFGRAFRDHYATALEGGPFLSFRVASALQLDLALLGVATDFIDFSPADARISSQNRDRVGQRVLVGLDVAGRALRGRVEAALLHDDAAGDAFDSIGGTVGGRLWAEAADGLSVVTGLAVTGRDFGPVGDASIIGAASNRFEWRVAAELGVRAALTDHWSLLLEDFWVRNSARARHAYTENVLSLALEATW